MKWKAGGWFMLANGSKLVIVKGTVDADKKNSTWDITVDGRPARIHSTRRLTGIVKGTHDIEPHEFLTKRAMWDAAYAAASLSRECHK
jgi:hypothetical protein